jgi:hypothetical protein
MPAILPSQEDCGPKPAQANISQDSIAKTKTKTKKTPNFTKKG